MDVLNDIYTAIAAEGFTAETLQMIDNYTNDIRYGRKDFNGFTLPEHAGLCTGGSALIGASIVACYARRSLATGNNAESSEGQRKLSAEVSSLNLCRDEACARSIEQGGSPANWQIECREVCSSTRADYHTPASFFMSICALAHVLNGEYRCQG